MRGRCKEEKGAGDHVPEPLVHARQLCGIATPQRHEIVGVGIAFFDQVKWLNSTGVCGRAVERLTPGRRVGEGGN